MRGIGGARLGAALGLALWLASCATTPPPTRPAPAEADPAAAASETREPIASGPERRAPQPGPPIVRDPAPAPRESAHEGPREGPRDGSHVEARPAEPPRLEDLIRAEEARHEATPGDPESRRWLATLYALSGRFSDAYRLLEDVDPGKDDFLRLVFAAASDQVNEHAAAMAALEEVRSGWRTIHPLRIPFAAFCSAARGFQDYTPYRKDEFEPGEIVGVYFELDDFATRRGSGGDYEVSMHTEAEVLTPAPYSQVIRLPDAEHYTQDLDRRTARPLEDLCLGLRVRLPRNLITGAYQLRVTVEDRLARKQAQTLIDFRIK